MNSAENKVIELRAFTSWLGVDGICYTVVKPNAIVNLQDAQENSNSVKEISGDTIYPLLVNLIKIKSISKEARDHFSMQNRTPGVCAIAMLIRSPVSRVIGNFFIGMNRSAVPTKLFTVESEAILWLKRFVIPLKIR
ncbi:MAG: STAS/SEC14 domain-containing protein [Bacteroidetes bacterium]|nr:STAS/SEC14 domain-containing protein [Bacteroidota bacterium]